MYTPTPLVIFLKVRYHRLAKNISQRTAFEEQLKNMIEIGTLTDLDYTYITNP